MIERDCGYLRNGIFIEPTKIDGKVKPCCIIKTFYDKKYTHNTVEEQLNAMFDPSYLYKNFKDTVCYKCTQEEKLSPTFGSRINSLDTVKKHNIPIGKVAFLQVAFSAFCNFKCLYCGPHSSTEWNKDIEEMQKRNIPFNYPYLEIQTTAEETFKRELEIINDIKKLDLTYLREVGIFGGEPFMTRHLDEFLQIIVEKGTPGHTVLQINTNASIFPKNEIIKSLVKFDLVDLRISGESVGGLAEYIRNGLKWKVYNKNIIQWKELSKEHSNIELRLHMAHNVYNINRLQETEEWMFDNNLKPYNAFVRGPHYTDIRKVLHKDQINECISRVKKLRMKDISKTLIGFLQNNYYNQEALNDFKDFTGKLDSIRKTSLKEVNPELYEWTFT